MVVPLPSAVRPPQEPAKRVGWGCRAGPAADALGLAGSEDGVSGRSGPMAQGQLTVVWRGETRVRPHRDAARSRAEGHRSNQSRSQTERGSGPC